MHHRQTHLVSLAIVMPHLGVRKAFGGAFTNEGADDVRPAAIRQLRLDGLIHLPMSRHMASPSLPQHHHTLQQQTHKRSMRIPQVGLPQELESTWARSLGVSLMTWVVTGCLPGGRSSMVYSARSPCSHSASVRGMGVAVMYITCGAGVAFAASFALCSTPNLHTPEPLLVWRQICGRCVCSNA